MADRKMGKISEQQAEAGRKSRFLQEAQAAPCKGFSSQETVLHEVAGKENLLNSSNAMFATSDGHDSLKV